MQATNSRHFEPWLAQENISLAVSTYTAGKLMLVGRKSSGGLGLFERTFNRCMGLWADGQTLFAGTAFQIWRFENILEANATEGDYDHLLVPRAGHVTGDIDVHDLAWSGDRLWFITTLFLICSWTPRCAMHIPLQATRLGRPARPDRRQPRRLHGHGGIGGAEGKADRGARSGSIIRCPPRRAPPGAGFRGARRRTRQRSIAIRHRGRMTGPLITDGRCRLASAAEATSSLDQSASNPSANILSPTLMSKSRDADNPVASVTSTVIVNRPSTSAEASATTSVPSS